MGIYIGNNNMSGSKVYRHRINCKMSNGSGFVFTLFSGNNTPYTNQTIIDFLTENNFDSYFNSFKIGMNKFYSAEVGNTWRVGTETRTSIYYENNQVKFRIDYNYAEYDKNTGVMTSRSTSSSNTLSFFDNNSVTDEVLEVK